MIFFIRKNAQYATLETLFSHLFYELSYRYFRGQPFYSTCTLMSVRSFLIFINSTANDPRNTTAAAIKKT